MGVVLLLCNGQWCSSQGMGKQLQREGEEMHVENTMWHVAPANSNDPATRSSDFILFITGYLYHEIYCNSSWYLLNRGREMNLKVSK